MDDFVCLLKGRNLTSKNLTFKPSFERAILQKMRVFSALIQAD